MKKLFITLNQEISLEHFEEIIVTALEGGSNYWVHIEHKPNRVDKTIPFTEWLADKLYHDPGFALDIHDFEDPEELLGTLTQESLLKGIELCQKEHPQIYHDLLEGTGDAETADVILQLAVMGEVVFG